MFAQTALDSEYQPVRDEGSTTYIGGIEGAEEFGRRIYRHAWDRGWSRAKTKVILAHGAVWIWNIADREFPGAIQIVDIYHARQHLWEPARRLFAADERQRNRWATRLRKKLDAGKIEPLVNQRQGFFIGSGVIEAACRTVVAKRVKQSRMFWTVRAGNAILTLCYCRLNRDFEDYWATRAQAP